MALRDDGLDYRNDACAACDGYYGPSFSLPVCGTCHAFLYPDHPALPEDSLLLAEKDDSGDSGTEEPTEFFDYKSRRNQVAYVQQVVPPKTDKLAEKIAALTSPREKDKVADGLVDSLPPEVLLVVFSYLNDISLYNVSRVCRRWRHLLAAETTQEQWRRHTEARWPLFKPFYRITCWRRLFSKLLESTPCLLCLEQMSDQVAYQLDSPQEESKWRCNRLRNELKTLKQDPPEGIEATPLDRACCHWQASIMGPRESPYEGGKFHVYLQIPDGYPMRPPVVRFLTKIFHPNISRHGDVGIDSIHHNWTLALTISKVLISIQSLLTDPYTQVCMEREIGTLYERDKSAFEETARDWTWKHAMHDAFMPTTADFWATVMSAGRQHVE
ncbi:PREDICTED: uncharacterized protein LOC106811634 [Priapulus caudatus]|uniref:Uncharacterized protein LOC106811634 n=1 Tax=Priapulus caudatus TaxID=37621 RepID=A0ABM1EF87_PRICU|nr:PREDICTED: uncharacterized protein LOC106811634 [Priapulus caudatus]